MQPLNIGSSGHTHSFEAVSVLSGLDLFFTSNNKDASIGIVFYLHWQVRALLHLTTN